MKDTKCHRSHSPCRAREEQLVVLQPDLCATRWPLLPLLSRHYSDSLSPAVAGSKTSAAPRAQLLLALRIFYV